MPKVILLIAVNIGGSFISLTQQRIFTNRINQIIKIIHSLLITLINYKSETKLIMKLPEWSLLCSTIVAFITIRHSMALGTFFLTKNYTLTFKYHALGIIYTSQSIKTNTTLKNKTKINRFNQQKIWKY